MAAALFKTEKIAYLLSFAEFTVASFAPLKAQKNKLFAFEPHNLQDWQDTAASELQGGDPWKKLSREVQGLSIKPYYIENDAPADSLRLAPSSGAVFGHRTWFNCPSVMVSDASSANKQALDHLENGADGIFFHLHGPVDFKILLQKIEWPFCSLNFLAPAATDAEAQALAAFMNTFSENAPGAWYGSGGIHFPANRNFHSLGHIISCSDSPARDIANAFNRMTASLEDKTKPHSSEVAVCVELGTDFFIDIAKLRAIRQTWQRLSEEKRISHPSLLLHGWSKAWTVETYTPQGNMIKSTTAAMSAILGGCDVLTIDADKQEEMEVRIARNTAILLREESRFGKVADPVAGSWYVDSLTDQLAKQVWDTL